MKFVQPQVTEDRESINRNKTHFGIGNSLSLNHIEYAVLRGHPAGYNQHRGKYEMPEFLAYYQNKASRSREGQRDSM